MDIPPSGPTARPILATPIPGSIPTSVVPLDAAGRINVDLPCKRCGYNLRTMMPDGRCPECATAVGQAMHGDYLKFADPAWVQKLASGINWIIAGTIIGIVAGAGIGFILGAGGTRPEVISLLTSPLGLIALYGYWRVTTPDPSGLGEKGRANARQVARVAVVANYAINPVIIFAVGTIQPSGMLIAPATSLIALIATIALYIFARQLAIRVPDPALAKGLRINMWGMVSVILMGVIVALAGFITMQSAPMKQWMQQATTMSATSTTTTQAWYGTQTNVTVTSSQTGPPPPRAAIVGGAIMGVGGCGVAVTGIVFGIWTLVLVLRLRKALNLAAEQALHSWAAIPVGQNR